MTRRPLRTEREVRRRADRGVAAVEFALVLPVLLLILFGIINFGLVYFDHLQLQSAARDGARAGALVPDSACPNALGRITNVGGGATTCEVVFECPGTDSSVRLQLARQISIPLLGDRTVDLSASAAFACLV